MAQKVINDEFCLSVCLPNCLSVCISLCQVFFSLPICLSLTFSLSLFQKFCRTIKVIAPWDQFVNKLCGKYMCVGNWFEIITTLKRKIKRGNQKKIISLPCSFKLYNVFWFAMVDDYFEYKSFGAMMKKKKAYRVSIDQ